MVEAAVIFLLFFAVLAFAWFYLQRAKGRDVANTATSDARAETTAAPDAASRPTDPAP